MIGKIPDKRNDGKSSFKDLVSYCLTHDSLKTAHVGYQHILSAETAAIEMEALATDNKRCKDPVFHAILSWREHELPTDAQVDEAVGILLQELNLQDCQALWVLQRDTENQHVHVVVNRIHPETLKAVLPANGWTYKATELAARKIELAQGWEVEQNGFFLVTDDGQIVEKKKSGDRAISQNAKDGEVHTATKSAERIAQEIAADIIRKAPNWQQLHSRLAEQGIAFEKKGSGAILWIGDTAVKASTAGRDISLSKLCERLGAYEQRPENIIVTERQPEPVEQVEKRGVKSDWERYSAARSQYYTDKSDALEALKERHKKERAELHDAQKNERQTAFAGSWKGRGALLNRQRSIMAAKQQGEKLDLADIQKKEIEAFRKSYPRRFKNFKRWLEEGYEQAPILNFRYPNQGAIFGAPLDQNQDTSKAHADLRQFKPAQSSKGGVAYVADGSQQAGFIDYGKKIILAENTNDDAILAALQLANQKWGSAEIQGTDEYKRKCVELAAAHNLRISNPDLAKQIEEKRKEKVQIRNDMQKKEIVGNYADAVGAERFRVVVTEMTKGGTKAFLFDKQNGGYEGKKKEELLEAISKFSAFSYYNKNIIVTPMSPDKHHILVDDLTPENLQRLKGDGYAPACVIESSPGNYQAILTVPSVLGDTSKDREAANRLTKLLNQEYGDPKLSGSVHGHRLPPFPNCKPKHRREDGSYPLTTLTETNGGICEKARAELREIYAQQQKAQKEIEAKERVAASIVKNTNASASNSSNGPNDPNGAYWTHYRDIVSKSMGDPGQIDYSRIDAMIGIRMRVTGYSQSEVKNAIESNGPAMRRENMTAEAFDAKYRNRDWSRYASETTEKFVFGARGTIQYQRALQYQPLYLRLEGRSMTQQQQQAQRQYKGR
ncbi:relaxase/mobilization nuclease domain-containing protein [Synergistaceae bacterium OttesenSCG-928-I11]|nr:relaxase/mobilization nuclease domain-containing protein [Synergistaceae bacterium OttesenSCG-928-I11]